jgi:hypothetical protein
MSRWWSITAETCSFIEMKKCGCVRRIVNDVFECFHKHNGMHSIQLKLWHSTDFFSKFSYGRLPHESVGLFRLWTLLVHCQAYCTCCHKWAFSLHQISDNFDVKGLCVTLDSRLLTGCIKTVFSNVLTSISQKMLKFDIVNNFYALGILTILVLYNAFDAFMPSCWNSVCNQATSDGHTCPRTLLGIVYVMQCTLSNPLVFSVTIHINCLHCHQWITHP